MAFSIVHGDIVTMDTDAIVNAANSQLLAGSGVCGAIFRAVGARAGELQAECSSKAPCPTGQSVLTGSYGLKARYIIHTVGPVWQGGEQGERERLYSCYKTALALADQENCQSIAFPLISAGIFGYPKEEALDVARQAAADFLRHHDMDVRLVLYP
ncbi:macro domain-containing protein [Megasphaera sp.]|uniref:macro domain-containing protein n=1 Tax=Megasphaera sp. TaxID=2023260 RepID=UPI0025EA653F|nr:macro domain-containing protein [uncultured Megasphaera sp.]